jgi:hypothetical protein
MVPTKKSIKKFLLIISIILNFSEINAQKGHVIIYNTRGSSNEADWIIVKGTPENLDPKWTVIENGLIRITYPCSLGIPGIDARSNDQKAGHLVYVNLNGKYTLAQDPRYGDWTYLCGSFLTDPTAFKVLINNKDIVKVVLNFPNHRNEYGDKGLIPAKKYITLRRGHYGYTGYIESPTVVAGERELGFGCTTTHYFTYTTKWGYGFSKTNSAPERQNYQFIRQQNDPADDHWWAAGIAMEDSYYRLVAVKPASSFSPALRAFSFSGGCTAGLIHYTTSLDFTNYEAYVAVVPYDGSDATNIITDGIKATVRVPADGHYAVFTMVEEMGPHEDHSVGNNNQGDGRRYEIVFPDLKLKKGVNTICVEGKTLANPIIVPISNGKDFPQDITRAYQTFFENKK